METKITDNIDVNENSNDDKNETNNIVEETECKNKDLNKLYFITFILDIFLLFILTNQKLESIDKIFVNSVLIMHIIFIYSLKNKNYEIAHYLHYLVYIYIFMGLMLNNVYLLGVCLFLIIVIQILWVTEGKCILNGVVNKNNFGYGKTVKIISQMITVLFFLKIIYKITE